MFNKGIQLPTKRYKAKFKFHGFLSIAKFIIECRNLFSIDSQFNQIKPITNISPPNPERGYRTKFEIILEEVFPNSIELRPQFI